MIASALIQCMMQTCKELAKTSPDLFVSHQDSVIETKPRMFSILARGKISTGDLGRSGVKAGLPRAWAITILKPARTTFRVYKMGKPVHSLMALIQS